MSVSKNKSAPGGQSEGGKNLYRQPSDWKHVTRCRPKIKGASWPMKDDRLCRNYSCRLVAGQPPSASNNSRIALENARRGVPVFPCYEAGPRAKQPRTLQGHHDATTDVMQVGSWWDRWPNSLVGIPTGSNTGFWVLDIDGPDGFDSLCTLIQKLGLTCISDLGNTLVRRRLADCTFTSSFAKANARGAGLVILGQGLIRAGAKLMARLLGISLPRGVRSLMDVCTA